MDNYILTDKPNIIDIEQNKILNNYLYPVAQVKHINFPNLAIFIMRVNINTY